MATQRKTAKRKPVPRHTRKYQFRNDHPVDQHVEGILDFWKSSKQEITNLRKAVSLYYAIEQGNLEVLFEMFPQYRSQFTPGNSQLIEQFMQILMQPHPANSGAGQFPLLPAQPSSKILAPVAQAKQADTTVSAENLADNFLNLLQ
jgi:hypothetical protein